MKGSNVPPPGLENKVFYLDSLFIAAFKLILNFSKEAAARIGIWPL